MSRRDRRELQKQQPGPEHLTVRQQSYSQSYSGPLPPPGTLAHYDEVLPGSAERILALAESQHHHRQTLESNVIKSNIGAQRLGVILGFVVAMTAVVGGIYLVAIGRSAGGLAAIIAPLAALVGVFVYGKRRQRDDLSQTKH